jgi:hypothetical protein
MSPPPKQRMSQSPSSRGRFRAFFEAQADLIAMYLLDVQILRMVLLSEWGRGIITILVLSKVGGK